MKHLIIGAGLTGLTTAFCLEKNSREYILLEAEKSPGGLCRSRRIGEFIFDYSGHFLHIKTKLVRDLLFKDLKLNLEKIERNSKIFFKGNYINYPFQYNLSQLPLIDNVNCLTKTIYSRLGNIGIKVSNFKEWIIKNLGNGIANNFMFPYNEKLWSFPLDKISLEWISKFVPNPSLKEIIFGSLLNNKDKKIGYNINFYYPKGGGIDSIPNSFIPKIKNLFLNSKVDLIDFRNKKVKILQGEQFDYDYLINTMPLPELINKLKNPPYKIMYISNKLKYSNLLVIDLGLNSELNDDLRNVHWIYFPKKELSFHRINLVSNVVRKNAPQNKSSLSVEISYPKNHFINDEKIFKKAIRELKSIDFINHNRKIEVRDILKISPAYVIYDLDWKQNVKTLTDFLNKHKIYSIGRYGKWEYSAMEDAILQGMQTAEWLTNRKNPY